MPVDRTLYSGLKPTKNYDPGTSLSLAVACELAYENKTAVKSMAQSWGFSQVESFEKKKSKDIDTQCYAMSSEDDIVVVFRGSDSAEDWLTNIQTVKDPGPLNKTDAHEGFQDALFPAVIAITDFLTTNGVESKRLWITGHSLGGALCCLYAGMLIENGFEVYGIYTFASPRPGTDDFAQQLNAAVKGPNWRVVNHQDIVPHVPPEPFFSHPGNRVILKETKRDTSSNSWWSERTGALKRFVELTGQAFKVAENHKLNAGDDSYIPRLKNNLASGQSKPNAAAAPSNLPRAAVKRRRRYKTR